MQEHVIIEKHGALGIITLNSERTLNSLTQPMLSCVHKTLKEWEQDDAIACVLMQGSGEKAFCAGGDVRQLYEVLVKKHKNNDEMSQDCLDFFTTEYQTDYAVHRFPKPIIAWTDRIVMGGGIGISNGASHRIVTERSLFAMPEIAIGLYPDVGATYFLNKMPKGFGLFLGLTGARVSGADAMYLGLADFYLSSSSKTELLNQLMSMTWQKDSKTDSEKVSRMLLRLARSEPHTPAAAAAHATFMEGLAEVESVMQFRDELANYSKQSDEWIKGCLRGFETGSPSSAFVIFEQLKRGQELSLEEVFQSEMNLSLRCTMHPDFTEGVRSVLVDKDRSPKWKPPNLEDVDNSWIDSYFKPLWSAEANPLFHLGKG